MIELLAPAGDMECLRAAIDSGADAVYCGGKAFSARSFAGNFDHDEMVNAVRYCHVRGKKIYVALNTMIKEREMDEALTEASYLSRIGVDALIVSDLGLAVSIMDALSIPVHASTQMEIHDAAGAAMLKSLGFKRVIPARELALGEIKSIADTGIETEVFVHGALCSCVSGLCLMSSFIGQRSGNRGCCAQPCRLKYRSNGNEGYLLSTADLCYAEHIEELKNAGVCSLKIEGRMKSSDYVAGVTGVYSELLKGHIDGGEAKLRLSKYYNRTFTDRYLSGGTDVCAPDRPDTRADGELKKENLQDIKYHKIDGTIYLSEGGKPRFMVESESYTAVSEGTKVLDRAIKEIPDESIAGSLKKTGGTPFEFSSVKVERNGNPYISRSELNALRRDAIGMIEESMIRGYERPQDPVNVSPVRVPSAPHDMASVSVETGDADIAALAVKNGAERIYLAPKVYDAGIIGTAKRIYDDTGIRPYLKVIPFIHEEGYAELKRILEDRYDLFSGMLAGHFSQTAVFDSFSDVILDYTCNIANGAYIDAFSDSRVSTVTLSCELSKKDILHIRSSLKTEMVVYGTLPVMWIAHDVPGSSMTDRKGYVYRIDEIKAGSGSVYTIGNPAFLFVKEIGRLKQSVDFVRMIAENNRDADMVRVFLEAAERGCDVDIQTGGTTQGHLLRGV